MRSGYRRVSFPTRWHRRGKRGSPGPRGARRGVNDYTRWLEGEEDVVEDIFVYDGRCPSWNDSIVHHGHFAVDVPGPGRRAVGSKLTGKVSRRAIAGQLLAEAPVAGTYSLNPDVSA